MLARLRALLRGTTGRRTSSPAAPGRPIRIGVDLMSMQPGSANGGIKPFVYAFLAEVVRLRGEQFRLILVAQPELRDELTALGAGAELVEPDCGHFLADSRAHPATWRRIGSAARGELSRQARLDVLYAPFGFSFLQESGLPLVSLIVDLLHRELPSALPPEEVQFRHEWFTRVAAEAAFFQCNSRYVIDRLVHHYRVDRSRCFHTYNAVHDRLPKPDASAALPAVLAPEQPYFFYPANAWPHKNHEALLVAYRLYALRAGSAAWPLVLTGHPDARMQTLAEMSVALGLEGRVHFLGHLEEGTFASVWSHAGALVFPSLNEGFGIPVVEAMRFGIPIIAATAGSLPEVVGDAGLLVDARSPELLADALTQLSGDTALRHRLCARGQARLPAFNLSLEAARLAEFLERAAHRRASP